MKLATFVPPNSDASACRVGVVSSDESSVVDLEDAARTVEGSAPQYFRSMLAFLDGGQTATEHAAQMVSGFSEEFARPMESVTLLAPVPRPLSIRDCMAFEKHIIQATRTAVKWKFPPLAWLDAAAEKVTGKALVGAPGVWYERPVYYKGNPASVVGPGAEIVWPPYSEKLDFELEFGFFIGRQGRDIAAADAGRYIGGYTIFNDFSARDTQLREMQGRLGPAKGKDFDTGNAMGPYLVTPDEIPDPHSLEMIARVNGEEWSRASSADLQFTIEEIIAYISQSETLYPGDFIAVGTAPGGCGLELDRWIQPGDEVELEVEGLGKLRNRVVRGGR